MQSGSVKASYVKGKLDTRKTFFFPGISENWAVLEGDRRKDQLNYCSYNACSPDEKWLWSVLLQCTWIKENHGHVLQVMLVKILPSWYVWCKALYRLFYTADILIIATCNIFVLSIQDTAGSWYYTPKRYNILLKLWSKFQSKILR